MHVTQMHYVPTEMIHTNAFISENMQEMGKIAPVYNQSLQITLILGSCRTFGKLFNIRNIYAFSKFFIIFKISTMHNVWQECIAFLIF